MQRAKRNLLTNDIQDWAVRATLPHPCSPYGALISAAIHEGHAP